MVQYKRETNQSYIDFLVSLDSFAMAVNWIVSTSRPFAVDPNLDYTNL